MRNIAGGLLVLCVAASADADLVSHNGTGAGGTGQVAVDLTFDNKIGTVKLRKVFSENAEHGLSYDWDQDEPGTDESESNGGCGREKSS